MKKYIFLVLSSLAFCANAQVFGGDNVTAELNASGLFMPHLNNCASTEVFLSSGSASNKGFCLEKDERSAQAWEDARQTCVGLGMRLPEAAEFKIACQAAPAGLNNITGNWEWVTNFNYQMVDTSNNTYITATVAGNTNCISGNSGVVTSSTSGSEGSYAFRCAR